jgi:hypothetical protein
VHIKYQILLLMYFCFVTIMPKPHRGSVPSNLLLSPRPSAARVYKFVCKDQVRIRSVVTTQGRAAGHQLWLHQGNSKMGRETFIYTLVKLHIGASFSQRIFYWWFPYFVFVWFTFPWAIILILFHTHTYIACWPLVLKFASSKQAEDFGFLG